MQRLNPRGPLLFVLVWTILWSVPALRRQNERALQSGLGASQPVYFDFARVQRLYASAPGDPFVAAQNLQRTAPWQSNDLGERARFFRDYDALIARFPARLDLRRQRLTRATNRGIVVTKYAPLPPQSGAQNPSGLDANGLRAVVKAARAGAVLAPDDGFFPWMEAMALWGLGREDDSLAALARAGRCARWNDGVMDEARQNIAFQESRGPLEWQQKLDIVAAQLLPHFSQMRTLVREVTWSGVALYRAGDRAQAWRRWEIALRAGGAFRRAQMSGPNAGAIGLLVGEALEITVWGTVAREIGGATEQPANSTQISRAQGQERNARDVAVFENLARREAQSQLATWSAREFGAITARRADPRMQFRLETLPWERPSASWTLQIDWVGARVGALAIVGALCWLLGRALGRGQRPEKLESATLIWAQAAFWAALWIGAALLAVKAGIGAGDYITFIALSGYDDPALSRAAQSFANGAFWWLAGATIVGVPLSLWLGALRREARAQAVSRRAARRPNWGQIAEVAVGTLLGALTLALMAVADNADDPSGELGVLWLSWSGCALVWLGLAARPRAEENATRWPRVLLSGALICALLAGALVAGVARWVWWDSRFLAWGVAGALSLVLFGVGARRLRAAQGRPLLWGASLLASGRVLGGVSLAVSLAYLVVSLALLPVKAEMSRRADDYVARGEVDWMRAQP